MTQIGLKAKVKKMTGPQVARHIYVSEGIIVFRQCTIIIWKCPTDFFTF